MLTVQLFLSLLLVLYLLASSVFLAIGIIVLVQWPKPHCCCFNQLHSDAPKDVACFSLSRINFVLSALWLCFCVLFSARLLIPMMVLSFVMTVSHFTVGMALHRRVKAAMARFQLGHLDSALPSSTLPGLVLGVPVETHVAGDAAGPWQLPQSSTGGPASSGEPPAVLAIPLGSLALPSTALHQEGSLFHSFPTQAPPLVRTLPRSSTAPPAAHPVYPPSPASPHSLRPQSTPLPINTHHVPRPPPSKPHPTQQPPTAQPAPTDLTVDSSTPRDIDCSNSSAPRASAPLSAPPATAVPSAASTPTPAPAAPPLPRPSNPQPQPQPRPQSPTPRPDPWAMPPQAAHRSPAVVPIIVHTEHPAQPHRPNYWPTHTPLPPVQPQQQQRQPPGAGFISAAAALGDGGAPTVAGAGLRGGGGVHHTDAANW